MKRTPKDYIFVNQSPKGYNYYCRTIQTARKHKKYYEEIFNKPFDIVKHSYWFFILEKKDL